MGKISLQNVDVKKFTSLIKRSSSLDNLIFITIDGSSFESVAYNKSQSALKAVVSDLERVCGSYNNEEYRPVKVQFSNANRVVTSLTLVGTDNVNIVIDIADDGFAKKMVVYNDETNITIPCADKEGVSFLELRPEAKAKAIEDKSSLLFSLNMSESEFKFINQLFSLNKESVRVFFSRIGDEIQVSEIEPTDENVRDQINEIITDRNLDEFASYEKLYNKKLNVTDIENVGEDTNFLSCFNKQYFVWIDNDKYYNVEFHSKRIKFTSYDDDESIKTIVVLGPVKFA